MSEEKQGSAIDPPPDQRGSRASPADQAPARQRSVEGSTAGSHGSANSMQSINSPSLSPWHGHESGPMVSSVISNLDLENSDGSAKEHSSSSDAASGGHLGAQTAFPLLSNEGTPNGKATNVNGQGVTSTSSRAVTDSVTTPLAPQDILSSSGARRTSDTPRYDDEVGPSYLAQSTPLCRTTQEPSAGVGVGNSIGQQSMGEDSALDALLEAHGRQVSASPSTARPSLQSRASSSSQPSATPDVSTHQPSIGDASFGLDPDADTRHSVQGTPFRPLFSSPLRTSHTEHDLEQPQTSQHNRHLHTPSSIYDVPEASGGSHTSAATGAPHTTHSQVPHTETIPTVSATGAPRIFPRRSSRSPSPADSDEKRPRPHEEDDEEELSSSDESSAPPPRETRAGYAPSGSLTIALFAPGLTWRRRTFLLLASVAINVGLPFVNGVMLGFGEIFARSVVAPWIGLAPAAININAPGAPTNRATTDAGRREQTARHSRPGQAPEATVGGVGLRAAPHRTNL